MPKTPRSFTLVVSVLIVALGACDGAQENATQPASPGRVQHEAPAGGDANGTDAVAVVDHAQGPQSPPDFDVRAFAGAFSTEGARLELAADGSYAWTDTASPGGDADTGTWTVEADGTELRLDPDSKSARDRRFSLHADGTLVELDGGQVLRRDDA